MTRRNIVLADADIIINLTKFGFFGLLGELSDFYLWDIYTTASIESECKDLVSSNILRDLKNRKYIRIYDVTSFEIVRNIEALEKYMIPDNEIELYAIAKCGDYNILSDDRENRDVFFKNNASLSGKVWVYNIFHIFYLPIKAGILSIEQIDNALKESHILKIRILDYRILKYGFLWFCDEIIDKNLDRHIDQSDIQKFK